MSRWQPDAQGRLARAALKLYGERGYDDTTVADIAERAGVTERTFFRYFADKREVLFDGSHILERAVVDAIAAAPASVPALEMVGSAMQRAGELLGERHDYARARAAVVAANASLQERELLKLASLAAASADALRAKGVPEQQAALAGEAGVTVFKLGFEAWIAGQTPGDLPGEISAALRGLLALADDALPSTASASPSAPSQAR